MNYKLNLNLDNLKIDSVAKYRWNDPSSGAAHEGVPLNNGTQVQGFQWIDRTRARVDIPNLMKELVKESSTLEEAFKKTAEAFNSELKTSLEQAPDSDYFDYSAIKDSQELSFEE